MILIWGLISLFLLIVEFYTKKLIAIWFSIGAFVSFIVAFFNKNYTTLLLIFFSLGLILMFLYRNYGKKMFGGKIADIFKKRQKKSTKN